MTRYIVHKDALEFDFIDMSTMIDSFTLSEPIKITNEGIHFYHLPYISVILSDEEVSIIKEKGIAIYEEMVQKGGLLGLDYQKELSYWVKPIKRIYTGVGCKVAVLDSGCNQIGTRGVDEIWVDYDYGYNFAMDTSDVTDAYGHGTNVCSIIKSSIGLAPDCELSILKVYNDSSVITTSGILAAIDWCIDNEMDIINMSFGAYSVPVNDALTTMMAAGTVAVAASGNGTTISETVYPAAHTGVVAVNMYPEDGIPVAAAIIPPSGGHGINIAASGRWCECIYNYGAYGTCNGTSFSSPFIVGVFAVYKQMISSITTNQALMDYIISKAIKTSFSNYYGAGIVTF